MLQRYMLKIIPKPPKFSMATRALVAIVGDLGPSQYKVRWAQS